MKKLHFIREFKYFTRTRKRFRSIINYRCLQKQILRAQALSLSLIKYTLRIDRGNTCEWQGSYPRRVHKSFWLGWQGNMNSTGENSGGWKAHMTQDVGDQAWQQNQEICSSSGKKRLHIFEITGWMEWKNCPDLDGELGGGRGVAILPLRFALHVTSGQQYSSSQTLYVIGRNYRTLL